MENVQEMIENIRLECLRLATSAAYPAASADEVLERAKSYEAFVFGKAKQESQGGFVATQKQRRLMARQKRV
jgi:hypothetical protein